MSPVGPRRVAALCHMALLLVALLPVTAPAEIALRACDAEVQRAADTLSKIFGQWPLRPSGEPVGQALQIITTQLAQQAQEQHHRQWRTHVLRDSSLNAFSVGDGHIFVTEGMLRFIANEAELAALLTHEFAHHMAGHFCQRPRRAGMLRHLFGGGAETQGRKIGELSASMDSAKEREADRIGMVMLARGGYDPRSAVQLASRMSTSGTPTHFQYEQRINALQQLVADKPYTGVTTSDSPAFVQMKNALLHESRAP